MQELERKELEDISFKVRETIIKMSGNGGCFIGASLSCVDIIVYLYKKYLNINLSNLKDDNRDYFFLSKGHDVPALYGVFAEIGFIDKKRLENHLQVNDYIYWHPNRNIPGIEFHSGSLGHLLSVASGVALDCKRRNQDNKIVVILGDGELNEGSIWEASLVAAAHKLDNLIVIVDRNQFQANIQTEELIPLEPLERKFEAFGWNTANCNGHDFEQLEETLSLYQPGSARPFVIIADTVRGKGLPSIEKRADRWFCNFSPEEIKNLLTELKTKQKTILTSETMMVR
jgi:transketolase